MPTSNSHDAEHDGAPHRVDIHVGTIIRLRRRALEMNQTDLAAAIGVTFQQVQKYELGRNRISASRLYEVARALKCSIAYFFRGLETDGGETDTGMERLVHVFLQTPEGTGLAESLPMIRDASVRRNILQLVKSLATDDRDSVS